MKAARRAQAGSVGQIALPLHAHAGAPRAYEPFVPGPNPQLPEFIVQHSTPYDPAHDDYDVLAFDRDLVVDKAACSCATSAQEIAGLRWMSDVMEVVTGRGRENISENMT